MKTSAVVLKVYSCCAQEGSSALLAVRDTDAQYGDDCVQRAFTVIFRGQSALSYPPMPGERIRFAHEAPFRDGGTALASCVCGRSVPGETTDPGIDGAVSGIRYMPRDKYFHMYIAACAGLREWPVSKPGILSPGRDLMRAISDLVSEKRENSVFFIDCVAMEISSLLAPHMEREFRKRDIKIGFDSMYYVNPLLKNMPFVVKSRGREIFFPALYRDVCSDMLSSGGAVRDEADSILSGLTDMGFPLKAARRLCVNAVLLSEMRYAEKFFLSLHICRENSGRIIRSLGPMSVGWMTEDPCAAASAGLITTDMIADASENFGDIPFENYASAAAGEILEREYGQGERMVDAARMSGYMRAKMDSLHMQWPGDAEMIRMLSRGGARAPFSVKRSGSRIFFEHSRSAVNSGYLASRLVSLAFPGKDAKQAVFPHETFTGPDIESGGRLLEIFSKKCGEHGIGEYALSQREAVGKLFLSSGVDILTGEPGSGKTTIIKVLAVLFALSGSEVNVLSPTGKAVKRIEELLETSDIPENIMKRIRVMTVHRHVYSKAARIPDCPGIYIADESSMLDTEIFSRFISTVPEGSKLILSGDTEQLCGAGSGSPFREAIDSGVFRHTHLQGSYRHSNMAITALTETVRGRGRACSLEEICAGSGAEIIYMRQHP